MGIFSKLKFWGKKDECGNLGPLPGEKGFDTGMPGTENLGLGQQKLGLPGMEEPSFQPKTPQQMPQPQSIGQFGQQAPAQMAPPGFATQQPATPIAPAAPSHNDQMMAKDLEVLSYKLDTLKAALDTINQRLANIERLAMGETERKRW